jgi:hypothetical protein
METIKKDNKINQTKKIEKYTSSTGVMLNGCPTSAMSNNSCVCQPGTTWKKVSDSLNNTVTIYGCK